MLKLKFQYIYSNIDEVLYLMF